MKFNLFSELENSILKRNSRKAMSQILPVIYIQIGLTHLFGEPYREF